MFVSPTGSFEGGADVIHGRSSHHPRPIEVYRGKLILYGCGDLINDYEGIAGFESYRDELRLLYFASFDQGTGTLAGLRMVPLRAARMRLEYASSDDAEWLRWTLARVSSRFGTQAVHAPDGMLITRTGHRERTVCKALWTRLLTVPGWKPVAKQVGWVLSAGCL